MDKPVKERITPQMAEEYINRNNGNRKLRAGYVERYADDMRNKRWTECLAPIAFYDNGDVADGQHRLWALIESNTTQDFIVVRNVKRESGLNIDTGAGRSIVDNARISGADPDLSPELMAVCFFVDIGGRNPGNTPAATRLAVVDAHRDAAKWAITHGPRGRGIRNQATVAAVARAWMYEADKEKLKRFCDVLSTGMAEGTHESAAVALRNYMMSRTGTAHTMPRDIFFRTQNAIEYFMKSKPLMVIKSVSKEAYPLKGKSVYVAPKTSIRVERAAGNKVRVLKNTKKG